MTKIINVNGREINLDRIVNPKLRMVVRDRSFMFSHSEEAPSRRSDPNHEDSGGYHHESYSEEEYNERSTHSDGTKIPNRHTDWTSEHEDYIETKSTYYEHKDYA